MAKIDEKIREYIVQNGISITDMAKKANVSQAYMSQIVNGKKLFGKKQAKKFHCLFGFNEDFLLTGNGNLLPAGQKPVSDNENSQNEEFSLPQQLNNLNEIDALKALILEQKELISILTERLDHSAKQLDRCITLFDNIINKSYLSAFMVGEDEPKNYQK